MSKANFKNTIVKEEKAAHAFKAKRKTFVRALIQEALKVHLSDKEENIPEAIKFLEEAIVSLKTIK